jgi:hypothetical protein
MIVSQVGTPEPSTQPATSSATGGPSSCYTTSRPVATQDESAHCCTLLRYSPGLGPNGGGCTVADLGFWWAARGLEPRTYGLKSPIPEHLICFRSTRGTSEPAAAVDGGGAFSRTCGPQHVREHRSPYADGRRGQAFGQFQYPTSPEAVFEEDLVRHYQDSSPAARHNARPTSTRCPARCGGRSSRSISTAAGSNSDHAAAPTARPASMSMRDRRRRAEH